MGSYPSEITALEISTLALVANDCPPTLIARRRQVSVQAVNKSLRKIYDKLGVHGAPGAVAQGIRFGFIKPARIGSKTPALLSEKARRLCGGLSVKVTFKKLAAC